MGRRHSEGPTVRIALDRFALLMLQSGLSSEWNAELEEYLHGIEKQLSDRAAGTRPTGMNKPLLKLVPASHVDHDLSEAQLLWLREQYGDRTGFFIDTIELPADLGTVPCALYGPVVGDLPVTFARRETRPGRDWPSRVVDRPVRPTRLVTVVAGPHESDSCVLYTVYGGPAAPREPGDPSLEGDALAGAEAFWAVHALAARRAL